MTTSWTAAFSFAAVLIAPSFAFAWGPKGHQIVAYIAEAHLTEATRQKIKAILPTNGTLAKASIWPDEIRKALPQLNPLHYVHVPRGETTYDRERDCPQRNCIVEAVTWYLTVFKSNESPIAEKQIALDYLVHLMGDLHQPLHVGFLDDVGGTKTKVSFEGKAQNLHELWDTGILQTETGSARAIAKRLDEECSADDRKAWQAGTPAEWANESLALTIEYVYPLPESHERRVRQTCDADPSQAASTGRSEAGVVTQRCSQIGYWSNTTVHAHEEQTKWQNSTAASP